MIDLTAYAVPVFLIAMLVEGFILARRGRAYEIRDTAASLSGGIGVMLIGLFWKLFEFAALSWVYQYRVLDLGTGVAGWALMFFADDFCYYWYHRVGHEVRFFWAAHVAHHSSERYTLATALRQSWTAPFAGFAFWVWLPILGLRPEMILTMKAISLIYQFWIHTELIDRLGPLEWIFNTPSHHRVHHGSNKLYLDKNHGGILIIWDRLFGTFQLETEPVVYGLTTPINTFNPVKIELGEFVEIARDVAAANTWGDRWQQVFGPTGKIRSPRAPMQADHATSPG